MATTTPEIPYGAYWSSPFVKWQGAIAHVHSFELAAQVGKLALERRGLDRAQLDGFVLGFTVIQKSSFYGAPWLAGMLGLPHLPGPTVMQACATSARALQTAASDVASGESTGVLAVTTDRCSNGAHVAYPNPGGMGGKPDAEDWVWDNFNQDPFAKNSMLATAENVAREAKIGKAEQEDVALLRHRQYADALADGGAFHKRFFVPVIPMAGKKALPAIESDQGVFPMQADKLRALQPVLEGGTVSYGTQTYPADGTAGVVVATADKARALSRDKGIRIRLLGFGSARVKPGYMAMAVVPAARAACARAGIDLKDAAIKTHNPFAVNDAYFARETGVALDRMNRFGSSLVFGHPQGPTGMRLVIELIEELVLAGGGNGVFAGCAAGDSAMAVALRVDVG